MSISVSHLLVTLSRLIKPVREEFGDKISIIETAIGNRIDRPLSLTFSIIVVSKTDDDDDGIDISINCQNRSHYLKHDSTNENALFIVTSIDKTNGIGLYSMKETYIDLHSENYMDELDEYYKYSVQFIENHIQIIINLIKSDYLNQISS